MIANESSQTPATSHSSKKSRTPPEWLFAIVAGAMAVIVGRSLGLGLISGLLGAFAMQAAFSAGTRGLLTGWRFPVAACAVLALGGSVLVISADRPSPLAIVPAAIPEGWSKFEPFGLELWANPEYAGGLVGGADMKMIADEMRDAGNKELGAEIEDAAGQVYMLFAPESSITVAVGRTSAKSIKQYADQQLKDAPRLGLRIIERKSVTVGPLESVRLLATQSGIDSGFVQYLFIYGNRGWSVTYGSDSADFSRLLPDFDRSAQTIRVQE